MSVASHSLPLPVVVLACLLAFTPAPAAGRANELVSHGGYAVTREGRVLEARALDSAFVPASTIKLVTGLAALQLLGPDYRFTTTFFVKDRTLYIRGSGDPGLTSATVAAIAADLARLGLEEVGDIALDASAFALSGKADGAEGSANPYDTANGALAVNYNAVAITVGADGRILPGEEETPLLPLMTEIGRQLGPGTHRVNPDAFIDGAALSPTLRYTGELFQVMLERQGIRVGGRIIAAAVPSGLQPLHFHTSPQTVADLVRACLHYSSNFIANQLFLTCGAVSLGWPATWDKGRQALRAHIATTWPRHRRAITMVEGSGLSRRTRITPAAMLAVLHSFKPYSHLLRAKDGVPLKTGSLAGVHCYAGYFRRGADLDPFVILLNQPDNNRDPLLARLQRRHSAPRSAAVRKYQKKSSFVAGGFEEKKIMED
ncbi:D-alanyl-D-alanine carboxypeptidase [Desulfoprunum benzoelyticum]|uniref:D-alanyl-D-alanine carboxypeptidase/D-alanyl-D-alanine-endopeptidase (Penicillin-binding protein 4) n=1 Tax=Desulfoprunum benzoelyticum TaxID=1506996 RepID=A0A840UVR2_9BACT|nr:D-alanyl-D-alanine carboxypeptidase [Desulfoprunum benzoelyticum]MBB5348926.1 D-alanyl-D-alanine carboxypeptidase/D-alanyl-D-alanine-endopeptidase (penicillin-binding protein 4) [Desulfoprunum benzoelyticum]MBM9531884.1 D-alanyl-D-alanine carboxypeptidase [Desulfoprunum benzoelyticum]